jgi:hypothetical protein
LAELTSDCGGGPVENASAASSSDQRPDKHRSGIGQHENTWRMAHLRGPEGIVSSLTERID